MLTLLQDRFPTLYPVVLERPRLPLPDCLADTGVRVRRGQKVIVIRLPECLPPVADFELLIHEYAHAMQWRADHQEPENDHDGEYGLAYARLCAYLDD